MSGEMVPLSSLPKAAQQQYRQMAFMMSRPRWDAKTVPSAQHQIKDNFLSNVEKAEQRDTDRAVYFAYQRSQRDPIHTGMASQPVGGRSMRQQQMINSQRDSKWGANEERAYRKAFGKGSFRDSAPTGY